MFDKRDNPSGLHKRYNVTKIEGPTDPNALYFVLRLDNGGSDKEHIKACRTAMKTYAEYLLNNNVAHLKFLAWDIQELLASLDE